MRGREQDAILDDPQHTTSLPQAHNAAATTSMGIISRKSLRQIICVLVSLARVQGIAQRAIPTPTYATETIHANVVQALRLHHVEASMDFFNGLQQMMQLAPGMRLVYRTNFAGMYNDVSQVIYFHYPKFARQPQRALSELPYHTLNLLPLLRELLPDIALAYDDDTHIMGLTHGGGGWLWLISCGAVFLVECETGNLYQNGSLANLLCFFLEKTGRKLIVEEEEEEPQEGGGDGARKKRKKRAIDAVFTEHGHVEMAAV
jgi:hypothetical protein